MSDRKVYIRDNGGSAPFHAVVKPHPGGNAGNVFGLRSHAAAVSAAKKLAARWGCPVVDETE